MAIFNSYVKLPEGISISHDIFSQVLKCFEEAERKISSQQSTQLLSIKGFETDGNFLKRSGTEVFNSHGIPWNFSEFQGIPVNSSGNSRKDLTDLGLDQAGPWFDSKL